MQQANISMPSTALSVTTLSTGCVLPSGWQAVDIGSVSSQSACESGATFTVKAMGCQRGQLYPHRLP